MSRAASWRREYPRYNPDMDLLSNIWTYIAYFFGFEFWGRLFAKILAELLIILALLVVAWMGILLARRRRRDIESGPPTIPKQPDYQRLKGPKET